MRLARWLPLAFAFGCTDGAPARCPEPGPSALPPSAQCDERPSLAWLADDRILVVSISIEERAGYGADFVERRLELVLPQAGDVVLGTATRTTRGVDMERTPPLVVATNVSVPRSHILELVRAVRESKPASSPNPRVVVTGSDTYRRVSLRIRDVDDAHAVELFTAPSDRTDDVWHLRAGNGSASGPLDPAALGRALARLDPFLAVKPSERMGDDPECLERKPAQDPDCSPAKPRFFGWQAGCTPTRELIGRLEAQGCTAIGPHTAMNIERWCCPGAAAGSR